MKRFLVFFIIVAFLGGGVFFLARKPRVKSFSFSLKEKPTEPAVALPPVVKLKVEKRVPVVKVEQPAMKKIDNDEDRTPDAFVTEEEPGSISATTETFSEELIAAYCYNVCDGDTIWVKLKNGTKDKIRFVGINTPEIKHRKRGRDEPGGQEAKKFVMDRCLGKTVFLDIDDESPIDYYGRTLALVYTADTSYKITRNSLNAVLLRKGYADVLYIPPSEFNPYSW